MPRWYGRSVKHWYIAVTSLSVQGGPALIFNNLVKPPPPFGKILRFFFYHSKWSSIFILDIFSLIENMVLKNYILWTFLFSSYSYTKTIFFLFYNNSDIQCIKHCVESMSLIRILCMIKWKNVYVNKQELL